MDWVSAVYLLAVWPWTCYLTCLMLDFLICKMDMVIFFIIWLWNLNKRHKDQLSSCASSIQLSFLSFYCVVLLSIFCCALVTYFKFSHFFCFPEWSQLHEIWLDLSGLSLSLFIFTFLFFQMRHFFFSFAKML